MPQWNMMECNGGQPISINGSHNQDSTIRLNLSLFCFGVILIITFIFELWYTRQIELGYTDNSSILLVAI